MAAPLHILFLCSWYPHPGHPTQGIFIRRHAEALAQHHHITTLYVGSDEHVSEQTYTITKNGNLTEVICLYPKTDLSIPFLSSALKFKRYRLAYAQAVQRIFSESHFDLLHLQVIFPAAIGALEILKSHKMPFVITEHWSGYYPEDGNYKGYSLTHFTRKAIQKAKAVMVISEKLKKTMQAHGLQGNYHLINNVVDTDCFKPVSRDASTPGTLKILHVSSLVEREKNITDILNVMQELKRRQRSFSLTIAGGNAESIAHYKAKASSMNLTDHIQFKGSCTPVQVAELMNEADVFLLFSYFEGMPVVLLEALACGLPVISTGVGAVPAMIRSSQGIVLQKPDIITCAEVLVNFKRENFDNAERMHNDIRMQYGYEAVAKDITAIYKEVLKAC